mgnify:CR=1 FL=1
MVNKLMSLIGIFFLLRNVKYYDTIKMSRILIFDSTMIAN